MRLSRTRKRARRWARRLSWAVSLGAAAGAGSAHAQVPYQNATPPLESIARIDAQGCPVPDDPDLTRSNDGTGFLWPDRETLVTAYHVVAGCEHVEVWFRDETVPLVARVSERSLPERDIALLDLPERADGYPLEFIGIHPPTGYALQLFGYAFGADVAAARQMTVASIAGDRWPSLADILNTAAENRVLATHGAIELDTDVVQLNGDLSDGQSGAPIFDFGGYVVGMASGSVGIGGGAGQRVNWAIGSTHLNDIVAGSDILSRTEPVQDSALDFTDSNGASRPARMRCGSFDFEFQETMGLKELYASSDQRIVLDPLLQVMMLDDADIEALAFDLWFDEASGTRLATPPAAVFVDDPSQPCSVSIEPGVTMRIFTYLAPDTGEFQRLQHFNTMLGRFSASILTRFTKPMTMDNTMYYSTTRESDRYFFVRNAFVHHEPTRTPGTTRSNYVVINNHGRGRSFVAVAALHHDYTSVSQTFAACQADRNSAPCVAFRQDQKPWTSALIAAHLSTMPER